MVETVKVFEGTDKEFYMHHILKDNLDRAKQVIKKDWDMIFSIDGYEGSGKSVFAMQIAYYCDPTLNIDRIVFNPEDFKAAIKKAKPYEAIVYDEAYGGLNSRSAMSAVNRSINQVLTVIRNRNLFIFIVLPTFFDLDKYVAIWRSRALINIYTKEFQRGYFAFYNQSKKKELYTLGKKYYNYNNPKPNFRGDFTKHRCINKEIYDKKKLETSITESSKPETSTRLITKYIRRDIAYNLKTKGLGLSSKQIAEIMGVSAVTISHYLKEAKNIEQNALE